MAALRPFLSHRLVWLAIVVSLGIGALFARAIWTIRSDEWDYAVRTNQNLVTALERSVAGTLDTLDETLKGVAEGLARPEVLSLPPALRDQVLFDSSLRVHGVGSVLVLDAQGRLRFESERSGKVMHTVAPPDVSFADRDYFQAFAQHGYEGVYIGRPVPARLTGLNILPVARALRGVDGRFEGVVVGAVYLSYFNELFGSMDLGAQSGVNFFRADGVVITRFPYGDAFVGRDLSGSANLQRFLQSERGVAVGVAAIDQVERLYAWHHVRGYPLVLNVAQATSTLLSQWVRTAWVLGSVAAFLMASCVGLAVLFVRELQLRQHTEAQLRVAEHDVRTILHNLPSLVSYWDPDLRNRFANSAYLDWFGVTPDKLRGMHFAELLGPEQYAISEPFLQRALHGERQVFERIYTDRQGRTRYAIVSYIPDREGDVVRGVFAQVTDITDRKRIEDELFEEKELVRLTLQSIGDAVVCVDERGRITYLNPVAERLTGWQGFDAADRQVDEVLQLQREDGSPLDPGPLRQALDDAQAIDAARSLLVAPGREARATVEATVRPILDRHRQVKGAVAVLRDVTEAVAMAARMEHLAQYDALTDLPNRLLLQDRARLAMAQARRDHRSLGVVYLDLDGFKPVNDSLGHEAGDRLLVEFARRLSLAMRQSDTVCRQGGDEFVVLLPGLEGAEQVGVVARKLLAICEEPFDLQGRRLRISLSGGISLFPQHGQTLDELSRHADAAMYAAKQAGRHQVRLYVGEGAEPELVAHAAEPVPTEPGLLI